MHVHWQTISIPYHAEKCHTLQCLSLDKALWPLIGTQCKLGLGLILYYKDACHIQELNANHALSPNTLPIQESDAFVFSCSSRRCTAFREKKKKDRKTGLWQRTALMTERDLSIAWTMPVSHPVIMGFITQPCTSLMLSLHLSLSLRMYAATGRHTLPHTHGVRHRQREPHCKQDIRQHLLFFW